jgi:hypothetical protein
LTAHTISETTSVSFSEATASGLEIEAQKPPPPFLPERQTSAASGSRTMKLR